MTKKTKYETPRNERTVMATGRFCALCGADEGLPHHDEQYKLIVTALEFHDGVLHCQPCLAGSLESENPAEFLLAVAARRQTEFWEALRALELELGFDVEDNEDLSNMTVEYLREAAGENDDLDEEEAACREIVDEHKEGK
jgi:hypothetical protein